MIFYARQAEENGPATVVGLADPLPHRPVDRIDITCLGDMTTRWLTNLPSGRYVCPEVWGDWHFEGWGLVWGLDDVLDIEPRFP